MKIQIVSVRDSAADAFMNPFFVQTTGMAIRSFRDEVNRHAEGNIIASHPGDFELFHLGDFDQTSGLFQLFERPVMLIRAKDCVEKVN